MYLHSDLFSASIQLWRYCSHEINRAATGFLTKKCENLVDAPSWIPFLRHASSNMDESLLSKSHRIPRMYLPSLGIWSRFVYSATFSTTQATYLNDFTSQNVWSPVLQSVRCSPNTKRWDRRIQLVKFLTIISWRVRIGCGTGGIIVRSDWLPGPGRTFSAFLEVDDDSRKEFVAFSDGLWISSLLHCTTKKGVWQDVTAPWRYGLGCGVFCIHVQYKPDHQLPS